MYCQKKKMKAYFTGVKNEKEEKNNVKGFGKRKTNT